MTRKTRHAPQSDWEHKDVFTTGEVARICGVSQQTIIRCFDRGRLDGFRVPGSRFRRIPRAELIRFMEQNQLPTDALHPTRVRVLLVEPDAETAGRVTEHLREDDRIELMRASSGFDAGVMTERFRPDLIVVSRVLPDMSGMTLCRRVKSMPELESTKILLICNSTPGPNEARIRAEAADDVVHMPAEGAMLLGKAKAMLGLRTR